MPDWRNVGEQAFAYPKSSEQDAQWDRQSRMTKLARDQPNEEG